jgi:hypothetical protein
VPKADIVDLRKSRNFSNYRSTSGAKRFEHRWSASDPEAELGLVGSFAKPGGNVTGVSVLTSDVVAKRLRLLHDLLPNAACIAVLVDPNNATITETTVQDVQKAAPTMGAANRDNQRNDGRRDQRGRRI